MADREVFSTRIDPEKIEKLKHLAIKKNRRLNDLLEMAIDLLLKNQDSVPVRKKPAKE